jgi:hypothetical protein
VESLTREWPQLRRRLLADSPYRELLSFTERDRAVFHGRTNETQRLVELLEQQQVPVLPVLGPSGVGKSSLIGAGLLGHLDRDRYVIARLPLGLRLTAEELLAWALASAGDADLMRPDWRDRWSALARQLTDEQGIRTAVHGLHDLAGDAQGPHGRGELGSLHAGRKDPRERRGRRHGTAVGRGRAPAVGLTRRPQR